MPPSGSRYARAINRVFANDGKGKGQSVIHAVLWFVRTGASVMWGEG